MDDVKAFVVQKTVKMAAPDDGNRPGALVLTKLSQQIWFEVCTFVEKILSKPFATFVSISCIFGALVHVFM